MSLRWKLVAHSKQGIPVGTTLVLFVLACVCTPSAVAQAKIAARPKLQSAEIVVDPKPHAEDNNPDGTPAYNTYEDYVEALAGWKVNQVIGAIAHVPAVTINEQGRSHVGIDALNKQLATLERRLSLDEALLAEKQEQQTTVALDPSRLNVYQRIDSGPLQFLVSLGSITPYLNGYKAVINVGNPSTARFKGITVNCQWSKPYDWAKSSGSAYKNWQGALRKSSTAVQSDISPGSWNPVEVILIPATPEELGYFAISIESNTVSLSAR